MYHFVKIDKAKLNNEVVNIDDERVLSGKSGCICLGCDNPLIARKGKINAWHFAHDMASVDIETLYLSCGYVKSIQRGEASGRSLPTYTLERIKPYRDLEFEKQVRESLIYDHNKKVLPALQMECIRCSFQFISEVRCCPKCGDYLLTRYLVDIDCY